MSLTVVILLTASLVRAQTPTKQIEEKLAAVDREVALLRQADAKAHPDARAYADDLANRAQRVRDEWAGKPDPDVTGPELHVVGVYEGAFPDGPRRYGIVAARVEQTQRPIILALCAYGPVRWKLQVADDVKIQKIILGGVKDQVLDEPPPGVPVEKHTSQVGSRYFFYTDGSDEDGSNTQAAKALKALTGLPITTLVADHNFNGKPLLVGRLNPNWVQQLVMSRLEPLYLEATARQRAQQRQALAGIRFSALYRTSPS
jgi:hypothetical protein